EYSDVNGRQSVSFGEEYQRAAFAALSQSDQDAIWDMQDRWAMEGHPKTLQGIIITNFVTPDNNARDSDVIFGVGSYLNHSCLPNVCSFISAPEGSESVQTITAARDIKAGDELTRSYIDPLQTRSKRRSHLKIAHDIDCQCELCSLEGYAQIESDANLSRFQEIDSEVEGLMKSGSVVAIASALPQALELIRLGVVETGANPCLLPKALQMAFLAACVSGKLELTRRLAYNMTATFVSD
ncbi:hypothetical protein KIPB_006707, partial [Kipferlia bialata]